MSPGFDKSPSFESSPNQDGSRKEFFNIALEDCSLEDPSDEIETKWSIQQCEGILEKHLERAEAAVDDDASPERVRVKKVSVLTKKTKEIAKRNMEAKPGSVEQKLSFHLLQVLGEKKEELQPDEVSGPKNMQLYTEKSQRTKKMPSAK